MWVFGQGSVCVEGSRVSYPRPSVSGSRGLWVSYPPPHSLSPHLLTTAPHPYCSPPWLGNNSGRIIILLPHFMLSVLAYPMLYIAFATRNTWNDGTVYI